MPRSKEQFEAMRQETLDKIHSAAAAIFARDGLSGTHVQEIADTAGISVGLLYRHYSSKEKLFDALTQLAADGMGKMDQLFDADLPPEVIIEVLADQMTQELVTNDEFIHTMIFLTQAIVAGHDTPATQQLFDENNKAVSKLAHVIEKGQAIGTVHEGDAFEMAILFFATLQGLAIMRFTSPLDFPIPDSRLLKSLFIKKLHQ
jgi:AcrR family transcriptional regulator